jgi:hypothetical protein
LFFIFRSIITLLPSGEPVNLLYPDKSGKVYYADNFSITYSSYSLNYKNKYFL